MRYVAIAVFALSSLVTGQGSNIVLTLSRNGQFTNLVDQDGKIVFTIVRNGEFTNLVDPGGRFAFSLVQNGPFLNMITSEGSIAFTITQNGPFWNLMPVAPSPPRRSEVNRELRARAEMEAFENRAQDQQHQEQVVSVVGDQLEKFRNKRAEFLGLGFMAEELDRFDRVLGKLMEANAALSKRPEPVRIRTGLAESAVDFEKRHSRWREDVEPHLKMVELCRGEYERFMEKYTRLGGK